MSDWIKVGTRVVAEKGYYGDRYVGKTGKVINCEGSTQAFSACVEFDEVLNAQGKTLYSGSSYLTIPHYARAFFFNSGTYSRFAGDVHSYHPGCRILHWKDFSQEEPDVLLKFEDIFGGDDT